MSNRKQVVGITFVGILLLIGMKLFKYAAPPVRDKDCRGPASSTTRAPLPQEHPSWLQVSEATINDASCLNSTPIYGVAHVSSTEDVRQAIQFARDHGLTITSAGQRHSMGGQAFARQGLVLDMRGSHEMRVDRETKMLHVQAGATWAEVQTFLDPQGLSVQAMQSINIFTVGGTLSVNAHGIAHRPGQVAPTVRSMHVMGSDGIVKTLSTTENPELFRLVLGGYGLFGVILDADIQVVDNAVYERTMQTIDYTAFPEYYARHIKDNNALGLFYARLSIAPTSYLRETALHLYTMTDRAAIPAPIEPMHHAWVPRLIINLSKTGGAGRWLRWMLEKYVEPHVHPCLTRNQAMSQPEVCLVSRNQEMYDAMPYLKNRLEDTDILQEYFLPPEQMVPFVDGLREIVQKHDANLLNVTIRVVHKDSITALSYAPEDRLAFVLYFNQKLNERERIALTQTTQDLIDLAIRSGGTFYLPYQLVYSSQQLHQAYPMISDFFAAKRKADPDEIFSNTWYQKYGHAAFVSG